MPDFGPFFAFLAATTIGLGMSVAAFYFARKSGLATIQANLVSTLKENAEALADKVELQAQAIEDLKAQVAQMQTQKTLYEATIERLRNTIADIASENADLRRKLHMPETKIEAPR
jgi:septal ring factor EnvC (AmiA/AmiB activator)